MIIALPSYDILNRFQLKRFNHCIQFSRKEGNILPFTKFFPFSN